MSRISLLKNSAQSSSSFVLVLEKASLAVGHEYEEEDDGRGRNKGQE